MRYLAALVMALVLASTAVAHTTWFDVRSWDGPVVAEGHDHIDKFLLTPANDWANGREDADEIYGYGGHDDLYGGTGSDLIVGGDGNEEIIGGDGWDDLRGGDGDDDIWGGNGVDVIDCGAGSDDKAYGGPGDDLFENCDGQATE